MKDPDLAVGSASPATPDVPTTLRLNGPMVERLRRCAADTSSNWDGAVTIYPPDARGLVALIDYLRVDCKICQLYGYTCCSFCHPAGTCAAHHSGVGGHVTEPERRTPRDWLTESGFDDAAMAHCDGWTYDEWREQKPITRRAFVARLNRSSIGDHSGVAGEPVDPAASSTAGATLVSDESVEALARFLHEENLPAEWRTEARWQRNRAGVVAAWSDRARQILGVVAPLIAVQALRAVHWQLRERTSAFRSGGGNEPYALGLEEATAIVDEHLDELERGTDR